MPRPRFTVRWIMVALAIVGSVFVLEVMRRRHERFGLLSSDYSALERRHALTAELAERIAADQNTGDRLMSRYWVTNAARNRTWADYYGRLADLYEQAASYPWLPVPPEPPVPR